MSNLALTWALNHSGQMTSPQRFVLVILADHADHEWSSFPSIARIADMTCLSERSVQRALADLEAMGLVRRETRQRPNGSTTTNRFVLSGGDSLTGGGCQSVTPRGDTVSPPEPSIEPPERTNPQTPADAGELASLLPANLYALQPPDEFDEFWRLYPRKVGKGAARKAWDKAKKRAPQQTILSGLSSQLGSLAMQKRNDGDYRPHPASWLNADRWADEVESSSTTTRRQHVPEAWL